MYGITQNPNTKNYILVLQNEHYCDKCDKKYTDINFKLCITCSFVSSGNERIDKFIQRMKINSQVKSVLFECLPYNQFNNIREVDKCDSIIHDQFNNIKNV